MVKASTFSKGKFWILPKGVPSCAPLGKGYGGLASLVLAFNFYLSLAIYADFL